MPVTPAPVAAAEPEPEQEPDPLERELISFFNDMQCQNHWQVLGLGRNASVEEIDRAYQDRCQRFHPERFQHILDGDSQEKLSSVRARLTEAFVTLSSKSSTKAYDRMVVREGQYEEKRESWETIPSAATEPALTESEGFARPKNPEEAKTLFGRRSGPTRNRISGAPSSSADPRSSSPTITIPNCSTFWARRCRRIRGGGRTRSRTSRSRTISSRGSPAISCLSRSSTRRSDSSIARSECTSRSGSWIPTSR